MTEQQFEFKFKGTKDQAETLTRLMTGGDHIQRFAVQQQQLQDANRDLADRNLFLSAQTAKVAAQNQLLLSGLVQPVLPLSPSVPAAPPPPPPDKPDDPPPLPDWDAVLQSLQPTAQTSSPRDLPPVVFWLVLAVMALFAGFSLCFAPSSPIAPLIKNGLQQSLPRQS